MSTTSSGTVITDAMRDEMIRPIFKAKDVSSQSGPSYWENLSSEFALAAGVLDPEFWDAKPWLWEGAIDAVQAQFRKRYAGNDVDAASRQMLTELDLYKDKRDRFAASHLWPRTLPDGSLDRTTMKPAYMQGKNQE